MSDTPPQRRRYPAIPGDLMRTDDVSSTNRVLGAIRECIQIFSRERGRVEDSMVSVDDLLTLGLITRDDLAKLKRRV